jgi:hypothetical protein
MHVERATSVGALHQQHLWSPDGNSTRTLGTSRKPGISQGCAVATSSRPDLTFPTIFAGFGLAYVVRGRKLPSRMQTSLARTVGRVLRSLIEA